MADSLPPYGASFDLQTSDGVQLVWERYGRADAPALVLLHCIGLGGRMWEQQIDALSTDFLVIVPSMRGHDASGLGASELEIGRLGEDIVAILAECGIGRAHLIGCSIGANIAMWIGAHHPQVVASLVLANGAERLPLPPVVIDMICDLAATDMTQLAEDMISRWVCDGLNVQAARYQWLIGLMSTCRAEGFVRAFRALTASDLTEDLQAISAPTLVLAGAQDQAFDSDAAQALAAKIPKASVAVVAGAAHLPNIEQADTFNTILLEFLVSNPRP